MSDSARLKTSLNYFIDAAVEFEKDVYEYWPRGRKDGQPDFIAEWVRCFNQLASELIDDARPFTG